MRYNLSLAVLLLIVAYCLSNINEDTINVAISCIICMAIVILVRANKEINNEIK